MKLIVIRNTETLSNVKNVVGGRSDEKLTKNGIKEAKKLKDKLKNIDYDVIISSPINRAIETANIINYLKKDIIIDERITERNPGKMLFKSRSLIDKNDWNSLDILETKDGVETLLSILRRTNNFIKDISQKYSDKKVVIITHNSVSRAIYLVLNINKYFHSSNDLKIYDI